MRFFQRNIFQKNTPGMGGPQSSSSDTFDQWAMRNGYWQEVFSGDVQVPSISPVTVIDTTIPDGQTWYRRQGFYTNIGSVNAVLRAYRTEKGTTVEKYVNRLPLKPFEEKTLDVFAKYQSGTRFKVVMSPDGAALPKDTITARVVWIALPWEE